MNAMTRGRSAIGKSAAPGGWFKGYVRRLVLWRTQQALLQLNDHMLRDIGLTREDIALGGFESLVERSTRERRR